VADDLGALKAQLSLRNAESGAEWHVPVSRALDLVEDETSRDGRVIPELRIRAVIDPTSLAGGQPVAGGTWHPALRVTGLGLDRRGRIVAGSDPAVDLSPAILGAMPNVIVPFVDRAGNLALDVDRHKRSLGGSLAGRQIAFLPGDGRQIGARLPVASTAGTATTAAEVIVHSDGHERQLAATLEPMSGWATLVTAIPSDPRLPPGRHRISARLDGADGPSIELGAIKVGGGGRTHAEGAEHIGGLSLAVGRIVTPVGESLRRFEPTRQLYRLLPESARRFARRTYNRMGP
jgi:hypothetical protein